MRNVNNGYSILFLDRNKRFILTMRNVNCSINHAEFIAFVFYINYEECKLNATEEKPTRGYSFILTMRNVNHS